MGTRTKGAINGKIMTALVTLQKPQPVTVWVSIIDNVVMNETL